MNFLYYKRFTYIVPGEFNELTGKQLVKLMPILYEHEITIREQMKIFRIITGISWWNLAGITGLFRLKDINHLSRFALVNRWVEKYTDRCGRLCDAVIECTEFLLEDITLTKNVLPKYRNCYGPSDQIRNLRIGEFTFSEAFFIAWKRSGDDSFLDKLCAVLYRPGRKEYDHSKNLEGDHREPFNPNLIDAYANIASRWPKAVKLAIATFYNGCREKKIRDNEEVFGGGAGEESPHGLWSVMRSVAKAGHFGDFDKVQDQFVDTILMELKEVVVEADKREAEIAATKNTSR